MPQPSKAPPAGFHVDADRAISVMNQESGHSAGDSTRSNGKKVAATEKTSPKNTALSALELAVLRKSIPTLRGQKVTKKLVAVPASRIASLRLCLAGGVAESVSKLNTAYTRAGWKHFTSSTPSYNRKIQTLEAFSDKFLLRGTAGFNSSKSCESRHRRTTVSLQFSERPKLNLQALASRTKPSSRARQGSIDKNKATGRAKSRPRSKKSPTPVVGRPALGGESLPPVPVD